MISSKMDRAIVSRTHRIRKTPIAELRLITPPAAGSARPLAALRRDHRAVIQAAAAPRIERRPRAAAMALDMATAL